MERFRYQAIRLFLLAVLVVLCRYSVKIIQERSAVSGVRISDLEGDDFRAQQLDEELLEKLQELYRFTGRAGLSEAVAATMFRGRFKPERFYMEAPMMELYKPKVWEAGKKAYRAVWSVSPCWGRRCFTRIPGCRPGERAGSGSMRAVIFSARRIRPAIILWSA